MEWWNDWKIFGNPKDGGLDNQEAEWVDAVRLINVAYQKVEQEEQEEQARQAAQKAKQKNR